MRTLKLFRLGTMLMVVLTVAVFAGHSLPSHAQAATATPAAGQSTKFQAIHMVSKTNGWAVITIPDSNYSPDATRGLTYGGTLAYVLHTQDGGQSWGNVTPPFSAGLPGFGCDCSDNGLVDFFFLDDAHAWVVSDDAHIVGNQMYDGLNIWRTGYSGRSWQREAEGFDAPFVLLSDFIDPVHGWLLVRSPDHNADETQYALLYQTLDGGATWQLIADDGVSGHYTGDYSGLGAPVSAPATGVTSAFHTGMAFESASTGWMTLGPIGGLLRTTDGGRTWNELTLPNLPANTQDECGYFGLQVFPPRSVTLQVSCPSDSNPQAFFYRTADDGKTWQSSPLPSDLTNLNYSRQLFMINSTIGWAVGCDSSAKSTPCEADPSAQLTLYRTVDAGKTWTLIASLPDTLRPVPIPDAGYAGYFYADFDFIDAQTGWAISPSSALLTTADAGKTWRALNPKLGRLTPGAAISPTPIATSAANNCPAATPPRLTVGQKAHITPGAPNSLRENPTHASKLLGSIPGGAEIEVLAGPVCDGQLVWWQVSYQGQTGWTPESDGKTYFIVPE